MGRFVTSLGPVLGLAGLAALAASPAHAATAAEGVSAWVPLAYLIAGVFFILALRGLSHPSPAGRATATG